MRILAANRVALATVGLIFAAGPAICQTVGKTAAVNPASTASGRVLTLGAEVVHKERIQTSESGSLQLLFLDRSTINIGPNSDVTIDEYIFDPNSNRGKMSVSIGKGLMRFVGGQISHDGNAVVKTPSATIGIRGAVGSFSYDPLTKLTSASNDCKDCSITLTAPNGQTVTIPPGHTATLGGDGKITLAPTPQDSSDRNLRQTQSKSGQTGGTDSQTSQDAANKDNTQFAQSPPPPPPPPPPPLSPPPPPPPLPPPPPPSASPTPFDAAPFAMTLSGVSGGNNGNSIGPAAGVPFLHPSLADGADPLISPVLGYRNAAPVGATTPEPGKFMQYSLHIGSGGSQDHWMVVAVGSLRTDGAGNNPVIGGAFAGTGTDGLKDTPGTTQGGFAAPSGRITTNSSGLPTAATINLDATYAPASNTANPNDSINGQVPIEFHSTQTATRAAVPTGLGNVRPAVTLQGYVGGIMRSEQLTGGGTASSHFIVGNQNDAIDDLTVTLDPSDSSVSVDMKLANKRTGGATGPELVNANLKFGGGTAADPTRSAYVDYDNFAALDQRGVDGTTPKSTVDGLAVEKTEGYFINASPEIKQKVGAKLNVTPCDCEYTRWGFWSMTSKQSLNSGASSFDDRGHMNLWVAGRRPGANDVPTTGEATYSGHVVTNVRDSSNPAAVKSYMAGANFRTTVNFGTSQLDMRVGTNARKLDGAIYHGTLSMKNDRRDFAGANIQGPQSMGRSMNMNGSFFRGRADRVGEMGGSVKITGAGYQAGGIFAGKKH